MGPKRTPWDNGAPQTPAADDVKVAGTPLSPRPFDTGATAAMPRPEGAQPSPYGHDAGRPTAGPRHTHNVPQAPVQAAYDLPAAPTPAQGMPQAPAQPPYGYEAATERRSFGQDAPPAQSGHTTDAYGFDTEGTATMPRSEAGAMPAPAQDDAAHATYAFDGTTAAMGQGGTEEPPYEPPYDDDPGMTRPDLMRAVGRDFEDMRRKPRFSQNKKMVRIVAVAAAAIVVGGGGAAMAMTGGSDHKPAAGSDTRVQADGQAPPAPLTDAQRKDAEDKRRTELKKRASRAAREEADRPTLFAKGTPPPTKSPDAPAGDPVPVGEAQKIARAMLPDFGWSASSQFGCLVNLWNKESHWNTHASNGSGAYGIPQALPGSKMSSAGPDWQNSAHTQIKWGLGYIKDRYSSPCGAWGHSQSTGWY